MSAPRMVGPVLLANATGRAVAAAICAGNSGASVVERGSYLRVGVPGRCTLVRRDVEHHLGARFVLPGDLECVMPSFAGRLQLGEEQVEWTGES